MRFNRLPLAQAARWRRAIEPLYLADAPRSLPKMIWAPAEGQKPVSVTDQQTTQPIAAAHMFGGPWTEIKLDAVEYYLGCYTNALQHWPFDLWYVDAFAGTGSRTVERLDGGLFDGRPIEPMREVLAGSARRALSVKPPFHHLVFIEEDIDRCAALEQLRTEHVGTDIRVIPGDANDVLRALARRWPSSQMARGVVFLDPYALQVEWSTLVALAHTKILDVWYLFPLRDVVRQLAMRYSGIGPKEPKLDRVLGPEWRELYALPAPEQNWVQTDLWGNEDQEPRRDATSQQIEAWFQRRLASVFPYASEPLPILTAPGRQAFSLFLAVANPRKPAIDLAKHFAGYVTKKYGLQASRRMSAL
jgi:three-Cys-motif partner protein